MGMTAHQCVFEGRGSEYTIQSWEKDNVRGFMYMYMHCSVPLILFAHNCRDGRKKKKLREREKMLNRGKIILYRFYNKFPSTAVNPLYRSYSSIMKEELMTTNQVCR